MLLETNRQEKKCVLKSGITKVFEWIEEYAGKGCRRRYGG
jgi:hypothetical protein